MNKDQQLLEQAYRLVREEANPDAKEDSQLKETFKQILRSYEVREKTEEIANKLFDEVQKHIKETMPNAE
jgi:capsular polysaccharide biosynthesis protein